MPTATPQAPNRAGTTMFAPWQGVLRGYAYSCMIMPSMKLTEGPWTQ
jgi:hypothetical protein